MSVDRTVPPVHLHIGGQLRAQGSGGVHEHMYPAAGEIQGTVPPAGAEDVDAAARAAQEALPGWRAWKPADRSRVLILRTRAVAIA
ncbi:hypothetical protein CC117_22095 [Parafrankia colletiae]|uniref:Aldehyde dehydrogenase domain-containing protein n=1 Tax=Parafrankia colletiae TaxID=573497 RepID=A0A1S1QL53_9ACTN|nr:aldehyde dehydrogenase family protein [Parafrankia colletiae]MCK9901766.1 aldehyde dehydrogenase family protein [Frankia sp. Cpl3]OHV34005.1 hypothetical protein CC117_22095 [Parafrankia colletiae]